MTKESRAQKELVDDLLYKVLKNGVADKADQQSAADWIMWLSQFVPEESLLQRRNGN